IHAAQRPAEIALDALQLLARIFGLVRGQHAHREVVAVALVLLDRRRRELLAHSVPPGSVRCVYSDAKCDAMRARVAASGTWPVAAARLSATCAGFRVPGITHVTAGSPRIHFSENCAQLAQPISFAQSGSA